MKTELDAVVDFLAGGRGGDAERVRAALADPASDASRFLTASRALSRAALGPQVFRGLGLPLSGPGGIPDLTPPRPPSAGRVVRKWLPWAITALAAAAAAWLFLTCPCRNATGEGPKGPARAARTGDPEPELVRGLKEQVTQEREANHRLREELAAARSTAADMEAGLREKAARAKDLETRLADAGKKVEDSPGRPDRSDWDLALNPLAGANPDGQGGTQPGPHPDDLRKPREDLRKAQDENDRLGSVLKDLARQLQGTREELAQLRPLKAERIAAQAKIEDLNVQLAAARSAAAKALAAADKERNETIRLNGKIKALEDELRKQRPK
jgi:hypothetical protein